MIGDGGGIGEGCRSRGDGRRVKVIGDGASVR